MEDDGFRSDSGVMEFSSGVAANSSKTWVGLTCTIV